MNEMIKVWHEGREVELARDRVHLFSRSEQNTGLACGQKRWLGYKAGPGGKGLESRWRSEDLELGSSVHEGLEMMLEQIKGGFEDIEVLTVAAAAHAQDKMLEAHARGLQMQDDDQFATQLPEVARMLAEEQAALAYALVWTFGRRHLGELLARYEVVAVEPEINWLVGWGERTNAKAIVMMSRPDAVLRDRQTGRLVVVSWKTTKKFTGESVERLECDVQGRFTETLAVRHWLGEEPAATLYGYFCKSEKRWDSGDGCKRYTSGLVRPYMNWPGIGELGAQHFRMQYTRLKGWERRDVWKEMEMAEWLTLLDSGEVEPEAGLDWLGEAVALPELVLFDAGLAERWRRRAVQEETDWIAIAAGDRLVGQDESRCFDWGKRCTWFDVCHRGRTIEEEIQMGRKVPRVPHHEAEKEG